MARWTAERAALLPQGAQAFLRRRAEEFVGVALFALAVAFAAALASYAPDDPSPLNATAALPRNWLGAPGAMAADVALQTLGVAAVLPVLMLAAWAWRIASHRGLPWIWLQLILLPFALLGAAAFSATLSSLASLPLAEGLGGSLGALLVAHAEAGLASVDAPVPAQALAAGVGLAATVAFLLTLGISREEWRALGRGGAWLARGFGRAGGASAQGLAALGRRAAALRLRREPRLVETSDETLETEPEPELAPREKRVAERPSRPRKGVKAAAEETQPTLELSRQGEYQLPPLRLLQEAPERERGRQVNAEGLEQNARLLETVLDDYGVRGRIIKVRPGPVVTLYELEPAPGTKTSRVIGLADDIARSMSAVSVRVATVPGRNVIGIELPNRHRETVYLRELLSASDYEAAAGELPLALGKDIGGAPIVADLAKMPHLLIAGTTGSGKSVAINTMILSLLYRLPPERCRMIMINPKMLELSVYDDIPHLLAPVVTDPGKAIVALKWTVREMESRYKSMARLGVRNIAGYNQRLAEARAKGEELKRTVQTGFHAETGEPIFEEQKLDLEAMPTIVVVVDEMADLMMVAGKEIEGAIQRLAQMARAAGIHIIMATQRPSVDVITGTIKANFPTRVSFQVTSKIDSRTILGEQGAEQLLGQGDMLFMAGGGRISRVHGPFVSDAEVEQVVAFLKKQGKPEYLDAVTEDVDGSTAALFGEDEDGGGSGDDLYDRAVDLVARHQKASTSFIQRHLQIGYNRAARIIERMEEENVIGRANHVGKREIFTRRPDDDI